MTDPKDNDKKEKIPWEPPRLFDLGGGVAHAASNCSAGGSPTGKCKTGTLATGSQCKAGGIAGQAKCSAGNVPAGKCKAGGTK